MNILRWIARQYVRPTAPQEVAPAGHYFTALGNAIDPEWHNGWSFDESRAVKMRRHVGQSAEGFHAGVEVCHRACDRIVWGEAHATREKAHEAARDLENQRWEEVESCPQIDSEAKAT